mmetsp:Transcript_16411/g.42518  ORF Transcript_16411/g.42518 Transcript_16411/m.42518 type:complete len:83 (-) Transcript_16411:18-266(-)
MCRAHVRGESWFQRKPPAELPRTMPHTVPPHAHPLCTSTRESSTGGGEAATGGGGLLGGLLGGLGGGGCLRCGRCTKNASER